MPRRLEIEDLEKFVAASHPQLSPDGGSLAYVVTRAQGDAYVPTLYLVDPKDGSPKTVLGEGAEPSVEPRRLAARLRLQQGAQGGGERRRDMGDDTRGGAPPRLQGTGGSRAARRGAATASASTTSATSARSRRTRASSSTCTFWFDGVGWTHYRRKHLHVVDVASGSVRQITKGEVDVACHAPSNKGTRVAYAVAETESAPRETTLYVLDEEKGECRKLLEKHTIASIGWSPDDELSTSRATT